MLSGTEQKREIPKSISIYTFWIIFFGHLLPTASSFATNIYRPSLSILRIWSPNKPAFLILFLSGYFITEIKTINWSTWLLFRIQGMRVVHDLSSASSTKMLFVMVYWLNPRMTYISSKKKFTQSNNFLTMFLKVDLRTNS